MLKGLLKAARDHGGSDETIAAVKTAAGKFHAFVTRHAGDRSTFNAMVTQMPASNRSERLSIQRRRAAYRAISQIWGVETDPQCMTTVVGPPAADGSPYTKVTFMMWRGGRRLRVDVPITLVGQHMRPFGRPAEWSMVPLDPVAADQYGISILPPFSLPSRPEKIEPVMMASGWRNYEPVGRDVGRRSSFEFVFGGHASGAPHAIDTDGRRLHVTSFTIARRPVALLVINVPLHRATLQNVRPPSIAYHHQEGYLAQSTAECPPQLPGNEKVELVGSGRFARPGRSPGVCRPAPLRRYAVTRKRWGLAALVSWHRCQHTRAAFGGFRCVLYSRALPAPGTTSRVYFCIA